MCIPDTLQQNILTSTKGGEDIAAFLVDTMQGQHTDAKFCHRLEATKHLIKYGFPDAECEQIAVRAESAEGRAKAPSPSMGEGWDGGEISVRTEPIEPNTSSPSCTSMSAPVTHLDILNYEIAHLTRHETAEGHTVVNFLVDIMSGTDRPFTPRKFRIKPADRMAAARELLRRGFGDFGSRRKLSDTNDEANAYDTLHTDLAKRMREYSERGADTIRFLLEVMANPDPDEEFTVHHRMSAAQELLRRGWDTNYDNIKPEHLQDYWRGKESTRLSIGQKKTQAGLSTSIDDYDKHDDTDYEAIARQLREDEDDDREAASPATKLPLPQGEGWGEGSDNSLPPRRGKARMGVKSPAQSLFPNKAATVDEHDKAIIKEFREAMDKGDERAALRAEAKYRRIDIKAEKNIYDYGPNDPDPTVGYYFEPLNPQEQAKFNQEDRREHGLTDDDESTNGSVNPPSSNGATDALAPTKQAAALHGIPILPNPLAAKRKNPTIRSP